MRREEILSWLRFGFVEIPATIVTVLFAAYGIFLVAVTLVNFVMVFWALMAYWLG